MEYCFFVIVPQGYAAILRVPEQIAGAGFECLGSCS